MDSIRVYWCIDKNALVIEPSTPSQLKMLISLYESLEIVTLAEQVARRHAGLVEGGD